MNFGGRERPRDARAMSAASRTPPVSRQLDGLQLGQRYLQVRNLGADSRSAGI
jgi:hypothetical protein